MVSYCHYQYYVLNRNVCAILLYCWAMKIFDLDYNLMGPLLYMQSLVE